MKPAWIDKTERYLAAEMDAGERAAFEAELSSNEELRKDLALYNSINKTMSASPNENELRETLQQLNKKYFAGRAAVKKGSFKTWMVAAASLLLLLAAGFYFLFPAKPSAEKLYAQFAVHDPLNIQQRGSITDSLATDAANKFNDKRYIGALPLLQQYLQQQPGDIQVKFSLAICYMETGAYMDAEKIFSATASGQTAYAETAKWYLALTALKQKDIDQCRTYLQKITATSPYFTKAKELLGKLPG